MMLSRKILVFFLLIIFPINIFAYSDYIIPSGASIGIEINTDGIMIIGFYKTNGKENKSSEKLKVGDKIIKVNDIEVHTIKELVNSIEKYMEDNTIDLTIKRNDKTFITNLELLSDGNTYKTGLFVKDSIAGIGTLTYIDPNTGIYGALGHEIVESNTNSRVEVKTGKIFKSTITSIDRSTLGSPGGKNARFDVSKVYGNIEKNLTTGIYGKYNSTMPEIETLKVVGLDEVKKGKAYIYTVVEGNDIEKFEINITKIDKKNKIKNIFFEITDDRLLEKTGGIVQGMSGSPIVQDNNIIGAVTHVVVSSPRVGYGISIIKMLEDGEK